MDTGTQHVAAQPLAAYARDITSSGGEDGIIELIFSVIGTTNRWCVELGALDGVYDSNTKNLIDHGWSAVLIEADAGYSKKLRTHYADNPRVVPVEAFVSFEGENSLEQLFAQTPLPIDFDLLVLDVDGNEYHLWESLAAYRPRVVCVEFNPTIPNDIDFVQPRDMRVQQGSSLCALNRLAESKGYRLVGTTGVNAFFVQASLFDLFGITDASLSVLHPDTRFHTRLFQLYDGTLVLDGYQRLFWHRLPLTPESVQALPKWKRHYPAGIHPSGMVRMLKHYARRMPGHAWLVRLKQRLYSARPRTTL